MRLVIKVLVSLCVIAFCAWIVERHKLPTLAGLIAVMPLTGLLVLVWVYLDNPGNFDVMVDYTRGSPASYLTQELKSALATSEIRKIKAGIGTDYPSQGHLRQIQPFGYHLGANKHIRLMVPKVLQQLLMSIFSGNHIPIPAK